MPELPEVETTRRELKELVQGKKITEVKVNRAKVVKNAPPGIFIAEVQGKSFTDVLRRGKNLILALSSGKAILVHFMLNGFLRYAKNDEAIKFDWVDFYLNDGHKVIFGDPRLFAKVELLKTPDFNDIPSLKTIGPEPLGKDFTPGIFVSMLKKKRTKIKPLLMDQKFIAGLGNLYTAEALFLAGIDPRRPADKITEEEAQELYRSIRKVLEDALSHGGSTVDNYVSPSGKAGEYNSLWNVYGREGEPCNKCGGIVKRIELGGRGTYFCPRCQK